MDRLVAGLLRRRLLVSLRMSLFYACMRQQSLRLMEQYVHVDAIVKGSAGAALTLGSRERLTPQQRRDVSRILVLLSRTISHVLEAVSQQEYARLSTNATETTALVSRTRRRVQHLQRLIDRLAAAPVAATASPTAEEASS